MPSLSDKLKSLGVKIGAADIALATPAGRAPGQPPSAPSIQLLRETLGGHLHSTHLGETYLVEAYYPSGQPHGRARLALTAPLDGLASWAAEARLASLPPQAFAFIDTETTGLAGGTGTTAFLIGAARFENDQLHLAQFFMHDPDQEAAQLAALEAFLAPCQAMVTFNGKTFDLPLLFSRYTLHNLPHPFGDLAHLDLLHLARRLWSDRLPSRTLGNLEVQILGSVRSEMDLPGWMIPQLYFEYLRDGDPAPLARVFYHNAMDVLSLAALMDHMAALLADPLGLGSQFAVDLVALAKLYEGLGAYDLAARLYIHALEHEDVRTESAPLSVLVEALSRLAYIYKRQGRWDEAVRLWEQAARQGRLQACLELAKYYEHRQKQCEQALAWTQAAIDLVNAASPSAINPYERRQVQEELGRRQERLQRKNASHVQP